MIRECRVRLGETSISIPPSKKSTSSQEQSRLGRETFFAEMESINILYFCDEELIRRKYFSLLNSHLIKKISIEFEEKTSDDMRMNIESLVSARIGMSDSMKVSVDYATPPLNTNDMLLHVQKELVRSMSALVGLEVLDRSDLDSRKVEDFRNLVQKLKRKYGIQINEEDKNQKEKEL